VSFCNASSGSSFPVSFYTTRGRIADFTEAIRLDPTLDQPYKNRAAAKKTLGDKAGAEADLNRLRELKQ
jgi:Flp pilus assembly protein TadD